MVWETGEYVFYWLLNRLYDDLNIMNYLDGETTNPFKERKPEALQMWKHEV